MNAVQRSSKRKYWVIYWKGGSKSPVRYLARRTKHGPTWVFDPLKARRMRKYVAKTALFRVQAEDGFHSAHAQPFLQEKA